MILPMFSLRTVLWVALALAVVGMMVFAGALVAFEEVM